VDALSRIDCITRFFRFVSFISCSPAELTFSLPSCSIFSHAILVLLIIVVPALPLRAVHWFSHVVRPTRRLRCTNQHFISISLSARALSVDAGA
jgi:hypothetical protein